MINSPSPRLYPALFIVSLAIIAYQLLLIQILSITQWYHFAYMIISIALLGFGASGTMLSLFRITFIRYSKLLSPLLLWLCGLSLLLSLRITQSPRLAFDSYLIFFETTHLVKLVFTYLIYSTPFFCGALFIGLTFRIYPDQIGKLYFYNLTGSALGGLLIILLLRILSPQQAIALTSIFPLVAAFLLLEKKRALPFIVITITFLYALLNITNPPTLFLSEYKSLSKTLNLPDTAIIAEKSTPYGLLQAVSTPYLRYAPGLSFNYQGEIPFEIALFNNGDFVGPLFASQSDQTEHYYNYSTMALPYVISHSERVLILESGSGDMVSFANYRGVENIIAVDGNPALFDFIRNDLAELNLISSYAEPPVEIIPRDPYSFLLTDPGTYDLIILPLTDAFGGSAGIFAIREKYLLTSNSFQMIWDKLSENGLITISVWIDNPLRYPLKTLATIAELLEQYNTSEPQEHLAAIRNWSMITYVVSKRPLSAESITNVRDFSAEMGFDILLLPGLEKEERSRFNILADQSLFLFTDQILSDTRSDFYENYLFNIEPAKENRPYFFQFLRIRKISELLNNYDLRSIPYLELGYLLILLTFFQIVFLTLLFVLLPLLVRRWQSTGKLWTFFYFSLLGLGFMMLEIVLIQRFIFYLGTPLYSTAVVISAILLFSGIGSYLSPLLAGNNRKLKLILLLIAILITLYSLFLTPILHYTLHLNLLVRMLLTLVILAPLSLFLGIPFPSGISILNQSRNQDNISWAWAINGSFSVVSTVLATIIAVESGFLLVLLLAALCYLLALLTALFLHK